MAVKIRRVAKKWMRGPSDDLAVKQGCCFDEAAGRLYCDFIETYCRQSKGKWAGEKFELLPWQRDFLMRLFGWKRADGRRRFKTAYLEIPKKNGKSTLISAITIACCVLDDEGSPEIYLNAVDREQASIVFDEAAKMILASPTLRKRFDVVDSRKRIMDRRNGGVIRANSAESQKQDGVNASVVIFDELHRAKTREQWEIFEYASESREQPLRIVITTAGEDESGPWYEQRKKSHEVNSGVDEDIEHLGVVYAVTDEDDLDDPAVWARVNPSLGHTIWADGFAKKHLEAKADPGKWALFCRLRLGKIVKTAEAFLPPEVWDRGNAPAVIKPKSRVFIGLDLSRSDDLTAMAIVGGDESSGFHVKMTYWLPDENIVELEKQHNTNYRAYENAGLIKLIPGPVVDYDWIEEEVCQTCNTHDVAMILVDPWSATQLCYRFKDHHGFPVMFLRQGYASISPATKEVIRVCKAGKVRHGGNPLLRKNVANAVLVGDATGNIKIDKRGTRGKIDGLAAMINAFAGVFSGQEIESGSVYDKRGITYI